MKTLHHILKVLLLPALLLGLPLLGVWLAGKPVADYFEFPPLTRYVPHAGFSWPVFVGLAAGIVGFLGWWGWRAAGGPRRRTAEEDTDVHGTTRTHTDMPASGQRSRAHRFPAWGWGALALVASSWVLAWTRFDWFAPCQKYSFIPLWLGYILTVNALTFRRTGHCMLTHRTAWFLGLFPASALFWWFFEYLNRFVQNWYYVGAEGMGAWRYTITATLSFSTVLPAVLGTAELLGTCRWLGSTITDEHGLARTHTDKRSAQFPISNFQFRTAILALSTGGLLGVGVWPDYLFPLLWLAPLGLIAGLNGSTVGTDGHGLARTHTDDDRRRTAPAQFPFSNFQFLSRLMLAGLICGFFWELWNICSLAKWIYSVPFVDRFHVFEMPLLGYAGYLPFGIECAAAAAWMGNIFSRK